MWQRVIITAIEAFAGAIIYLPILLLLNRPLFRSKKTTAYSVFAFYVASLYAITGIPTIYNCSFDGFVYLVPFVGMAYDVLNSFLNVILFVPLGFFLPFLCYRFGKLKNTLLFGFLTSFSVELLQLFTYRKTDINDIITNTVGTLVGFLAFRLITRKQPKAKVHGSIKELFVVLVAVFATMFFIQPVIVSFAKEIIW